MKNNHTHLTRLAAISLVVVMCLSSLAVLAPSAAAHTYGGNATRTTGGAVDLLNIDFERDVIGTTPDFGHYAKPTNASMTVVDLGGDHGQALHIQAMGKNRRSSDPQLYGHWTSGAYLGLTSMSSFSFSFDIQFTEFYIGDFSIGLTSGLYNNAPLSEIKGYPELTFGRFGSDESGYGTPALKYFGTGMPQFPLEKNRWYNVRLDVDTIKQTTTTYLDGIQMHIEPFSVPYYYKFKTLTIRFGHQMSDYCKTSLYLDNIRVTVPEHEVQPWSAMDSRTGLSITFDGAYTGVWENAVPILGDYPAVLAPVVDWVGNWEHVMSWAQIQYLVDQGWEIMPHGVDMLDSTLLDEEALRYQYTESIRRVHENITGAEILGWTYPFDLRNEYTDQIAWEYYEYIGDGDDVSSMNLQRCKFWATGMNQLYGLTKYLMALVYGSHGWIDGFTHDVSYSPDYNALHPDVLEYFIDRCRQNDTRISVPSEYYRESRNMAYAVITGDRECFSLSFPDRGNFTMTDTLIRMPRGYVYDDGVTRIDGSYSWSTVGVGTHRLAMLVSPSGDLTIDMPKTGASGSISWMAEWSGLGTHEYEVLGLKPSSTYDVFADGQLIMSSIRTDRAGILAFTFVGTDAVQIEIKPTSMTAAMDGVAAAIGIVVALAVLGGVLGMLGTAFGKLGKQFKR